MEMELKKKNDVEKYKDFCALKIPFTWPSTSKTTQGRRHALPWKPNTTSTKRSPHQISNCLNSQACIRVK